MLYVLCGFLGYLLGNAHPSIIISRMLYKRDVRDEGSGNAGATNMLRTFGLTAGALTFFLDVIKGIVAYLIGMWIAGIWGACVAGVAVVVGHDWPAFYRFRGGKGIASSIGIGIMAQPDIGIISLLTGVLVVFLTKYVSAGSLVGFSVFTLYALLVLPWPLKVMGMLLCVLAYIRHADNLTRLMNDTESKISVGRRRF